LKNSLDGGGVSDPPSPRGTGGFRGWRDDRALSVAPSKMQPCFDASDKVFVGGVRIMRSYPLLRLAVRRCRLNQYNLC
jgi:hypothetical protein